MNKYFLPLLWLEIILCIIDFLFNFTEEMVILGLENQVYHHHGREACQQTGMAARAIG